MAATGDLRSLLGPATFNQIPSHPATVLQELWTNHTDMLRTKEEKVRRCNWLAKPEGCLFFF